MSTRKLCSLVLAVAAACLLLAIITSSKPQPPAAPSLTGIVTSDAEGPMEGVLVKAKKDGGNITITVVSDDHGKYSFPADRIKPGQYTVSVKATGYQIPNRSMPVTVGAATTTQDLKLVTVSPAVLLDQLMPAEVVRSLPGTPAQVRSAEGCAGCHSFSRVLKSTHTADEFKDIIVRMRNHTPSANDAHPENTPFHQGPSPRDGDLANYLASINLSTKTKWDFQFKPFPRPKGASTKVIITEFDLPRPDGEPHDTFMDSEGMIWYADFVSPYVGRLNPRTGEFKEWPLPLIHEGIAPGSLGVALDKNGNPWIARSFQGGVATLDKLTGKVTTYPIPAENFNDYVRTSFVAVAPDGTVGFDDTFNRMMYFVNPRTGKVVGYPAYPGWKWDTANPGRMGFGPNGEKEDHFMYGVAFDSKGTIYWGDTANRNVGAMDPETGKTMLYPTPTPNSGPHRMEMGPSDKLWFAEIGARKIGFFDTVTKEFKEWAAPGDDDPYGVDADKAGYVWAGGTPTDYVDKLDPKTGVIVQYLLPNSNVNIRRVRTYDLTNPPSMMIGENHQAKIALIQSLP